MRKSHFIIGVLLIALMSCDSSTSGGPMDDNNDPPIDDNSYFPPIGSDNWETSTLEELGWNSANEQDLYDFLEANDSKAFIVLKDGKIAIEKYFNGGSQVSDHPWYSAGKTITALMVGIAMEEGYLELSDPSMQYLGESWSSLTTEQEQNITVWNHLTMTTGLDYSNVFLQSCTLPGCLTYLNEPGTFWYYHNAPYTITQAIVGGATGSFFINYFNSKLKDRIGMNGFWQSDNFNNIYNSSARSMARFGLLMLNEGQWADDMILNNDSSYFHEMTSTSQNLNKAYGYLWWLNGKDSIRVPGSTDLFAVEMIPNAPDDLVAGLGFNDQKLYIVPSRGLVIIRMGDDAGESLLGPSSFDNALWEKINAVIN